MPTSAAEAASARRRLQALLAADAAGYSRLMQLDERRTLAQLDEARSIFREQIEQRAGRVVDMAGDSVLAVFDTAGGAVEAAEAVQRLWSQRQAARPEEERLTYRVGVHLGDVIEKADGSVYGTGVNVAARLQALAAPGEVWASHAVRGAVGATLAERFADRGLHEVKNIAEPVHAFCLQAAGALPGPRRRLRWSRARVFATLGLALAAGVTAFVLAGRATMAPAAATPRPLAMAVAPFENEPAGARAALLAAFAAPRHRYLLAVWPIEQGEGALASARAAGARFLLRGRGRPEGGAEPLQLELVDSGSGELRWSGQGAAPALADQVAVALFGLETRRVLGLPLERLQPVELFLRAGAVYDERPTLTGIDEALRLVERALALDPDHVPSLSHKAFLLLNRYDEEAAPDHQRYARELDAMTARLVVLAADNPFGWSLRARSLAMSHQWSSALEASERTMKLEGRSEFALGDRAELLLMLGRVDEALALTDEEHMRDGRSSHGFFLACHGRLLKGSLQAAVDACEKSVGRSPTMWSAHLFMAAAQGLQGRTEAAQASLQVVERMSPGHTIARLRGYLQWSHPDYRRLAEPTLYEGLRRAGMPEG